MATFAETEPRILYVYLNDVDVGTIALLPDDRTLFAFGKAYIDTSERAILSQWFLTELNELKTNEKLCRGASLPPFFSNLLPEGHLRQYLAKKAGVNPQREFFLLSALGQDLPGAVRISAVDTTGDDMSRNVVHRAQTASSVLRFSLAGVQLKFSAIMEPAGGLTIPADGAGGSWIVKLPSSSFAQLPEAEFAMLTLARAAGIVVPEFHLVKTESIAGLPSDLGDRLGDSLVVRRFDRGVDGARVHMEDFAQIFGLYPAEKYDTARASFDKIGFVILGECGEEDFIEFIRRLVFTLAIGNGDMHAKNWSLLYTDPRRPKLSPAYDFVPSLIYLPGDDLGLNLGSCKAFKEISGKHFAKLAERAHASERLVLNTVRDTLPRISTAWEEFKSDLPLSNETLKSINTHLLDTLVRLK